MTTTEISEKLFGEYYEAKIDLLSVANDSLIKSISEYITNFNNKLKLYIIIDFTNEAIIGLASRNDLGNEINIKIPVDNKYKLLKFIKIYQHYSDIEEFIIKNYNNFDIIDLTIIDFEENTISIPDNCNKFFKDMMIRRTKIKRGN